MKEIVKSWGLWILAVALIGIGMLYFESDMLWKVQQLNPFLYTPLFFRQQMLVSGGLLSYVSAFFTQFLFHPWLGVLMLCGWWLLLAWLISRTFRLGPLRPALALTPIALLAIANMDMGYWIYVMKLGGWFFCATIGTTAVTALLWGFRCTAKHVWLRAAYIALTAIVGYPLMGCYGLAATLLMGIWTWRLGRQHTQNAILTATAIICTIAIPLLYYRYVYDQTNLTSIWWTGLPTFSFHEDYPKFYTPYAILAKYFLLLVLTYRYDFQPKKLKWVRIRQGLLVAVLAFLVYHFWYKDKNFHHELVMQRCVEQCDWEGVIHEGKKQDSEPTRAIVMMHNLALSRLGRQCDEMYDFPKGSEKPNTPLSIYMYHIAGKYIYYQYGMLNDCHRICMEEGVEYGWRIDVLQYMARCALLMNEQQAARKFIDLLRQTQFYDDWADQMESLIGHPEKIAEAQETGPITHMMHYGNILGGDQGYVERHLMNILSKSDSTDPFFQEQALIATLWTRNPTNFWRRFSKYMMMLPHGTMPRIFQEAAYLFADMQNRDISGLPFDQGVVRSYKAFMRQLQRLDGATLEQAREALYPSFGNTYYYEYFFLKDITYL